MDKNNCGTGSFWDFGVVFIFLNYYFFSEGAEEDYLVCLVISIRLITIQRLESNNLGWKLIGICYVHERARRLQAN